MTKKWFNKVFPKAKLAKLEDNVRQRSIYPIWAHEFTLLSKLTLHNLAYNPSWATPISILHRILYYASMLHTNCECEGYSAESVDTKPLRLPRGQQTTQGGFHCIHLLSPKALWIHSKACLICSHLLSKAPNKCFLNQHSAACLIDLWTLGGTVDSLNPCKGPGQVNHTAMPPEVSSLFSGNW